MHPSDIFVGILLLLLLFFFMVWYLAVGCAFGIL